ncbi:glycosyltransferase family 2 protein [Fibrisoma montanum]|uniref:Glycosyltransferase family 2 protein n=1 Tax=Fibrisoma montanum TaxID=2305895 RepID=A0A418MAL9_9BACT|nr:glycosyltransferase family 2 protein [Fibrisoma montanum]RIV23422.1 glycosyltransferase family 2 protein [Fibrisoma montanum]
MIYIVIPVFNRIGFTINCLESLLNQSFDNIKVIVVDDGSTDNTYEIIKQSFPDVIILKGDGTLWWAGATNKGVEYALSNSSNLERDFILTLNNDLIVKEDYIESLINCFNNNKPCLVGSVSVDIENPEKVEYLGVRWNRLTAKLHRVAQASNKKSYSQLLTSTEILPSDLLSGRGTLIPLVLFKQIGLYDTVRFPQYAADDDFSYRAKQAGYKLILSTKSVVLSHCKATGLHLSAQKPTYKVLWQAMTSIKSPTNLKVRFHWAMKNTELKIVYFLIDSLRIIASFHFKMLRRLISG